MAENQEVLDKKIEEYIQQILTEHPTWIYTDGVVYDEDDTEKFVRNNDVA